MHALCSHTRRLMFGCPSITFAGWTNRIDLNLCHRLSYTLSTCSGTNNEFSHTSYPKKRFLKHETQPASNAQQRKSGSLGPKLVLLVLPENVWSPWTRSHERPTAVATHNGSILWGTAVLYVSPADTKKAVARFGLVLNDEGAEWGPPQLSVLTLRTFINLDTGKVPTVAISFHL